METGMARRGGAYAALAVILAVAVLLVVVGLWRGWWRFSVASDKTDDQVQLQMNVDKGRIQQDARGLTDKAREATQSASVAAQLRTVEGELQAVHHDKNQLVLEVDDKRMEFALSDATEFVGMGNKSALEGVQPGERVRVTYREGEKGPLALTVKLVSPSEHS